MCIIGGAPPYQAFKSSPGTVTSSAHRGTERGFCHHKESHVQDDLVIHNIQNGECSGKADLSQPFDIKWQIYLLNNDTLYVV
jgi:hypothetical protein